MGPGQEAIQRQSNSWNFARYHKVKGFFVKQPLGLSFPFINFSMSFSLLPIILPPWMIHRIYDNEDRGQWTNNKGKFIRFFFFIARSRSNWF